MMHAAVLSFLSDLMVRILKGFEGVRVEDMRV
jgi:hypothetical protein